VERLGFVSTEGGPLLIADRAVLGGWSGADGPDYDRACDLLEEALDADDQAQGLLVEVPIGESSALLWDLAPGTVTVCRSEDGLVMVECSDDAPDGSCQEPEPGPGDGIVLEISSGFLVVLWGPESGAEATADGPEDGRMLDLSVQEAGIELAWEPGTYLASSTRRTAVAGAVCRVRPRG